MQNEGDTRKQKLHLYLLSNSNVCLSSYWEFQTFKVLHEINMLKICTMELTPTLIFFYIIKRITCTAIVSSGELTAVLGEKNKKQLQ